MNDLAMGGSHNYIDSMPLLKTLLDSLIYSVVKQVSKNIIAMFQHYIIYTSLDMIIALHVVL